MKKILFLADGNSSHTQKWAEGLLKAGFKIGIFSLSSIGEVSYSSHPNCSILFSGNFNGKFFRSGALNKLIYLRCYSKLLKAIKEFKPDIVHAHYATSYGFLASLTGFKPFVLSVWGSDVYDFPQKSILHRMLLKYNLSKADKILSTSHVMAKEIAKYTLKNIAVTPFGIDLEVFKPMQVESIFEKNDIVIGTIKSLEKKYGIDYLIDAFAALKQQHPHLPLKLLVVGGGSMEAELKNKCKELEVDFDTKFTGKVSQAEVPLYHNMITVYASLSIFNSESFGVAAIEASACEKPVVVSDVDGFKEVVENGVTGIIVPKKNSEETKKALEYLMLHKDIATQYGKNGRKRVQQLYNWSDNLKSMIDIYHEVLN